MTFKVKFIEGINDLGIIYTTKKYFIDVYSSLVKNKIRPKVRLLLPYTSLLTNPTGTSEYREVKFSTFYWGTPANPYGTPELRRFYLLLKHNHQLWVWGDNQLGNLGDNSVIDRSSPVQIGAGLGWRKIAIGVGYCAGITANGALYTWGTNEAGELGVDIGTNFYRSSPVQVGNEYTWRLVSCGLGSENGLGSPGQANHTAAIKSDGTLWTWGRNDNGQLALPGAAEFFPTLGSRSSPVQVGSDTTWKLVSCGYKATAAIKTNGTLWTWGRNISGQLGVNDRVARSSPTQVGSDTTWSSISCGYVCGAIKSDGTLWTWGQNNIGQLGVNDRDNRSSPTQVAGTNWMKISCADTGIVSGNANNITRAIKTDGTLWSWGWNDFNYIGDNTTIHRSNPVQITGNNWVYVDSNVALQDDYFDYYNDNL